MRVTDDRSSASRYWNTLRHLRPIQIGDRFWRAIYHPRPRLENFFELRRPRASWIEPARVEPTMRGPEEFEFLSVRRQIRSVQDWNEQSWPLLWRFHLHYFDDLNADGFQARSGWHYALVERWIAENPPRSPVAWDPYPTSLRVVNWIKWWLGGAATTSNALHSIRLQIARVMSRLEYHLLGNHLLENARALVFGGLFFEGRDADRWLRRGARILEEQLPEQVLDDGGHFERSPMYHEITLTGLLDLYNIMGVFDRPERSGLAPYIERMLRWSALMRHPDGDIALFNDAAFHEAPAPRALEAYAHRLGIALPAMPGIGATGVHLKSSGYVRVGRERYTAILNVGSVAPAYQPGHAHADTLSFELSLMGRRLFVDTGTSTYERGTLRRWQRGSEAHNTVVVNGLNSSDVWGGFRVARRARILAASVSADGTATRVSAAHDGYRHLSERVVHERRWDFSSDHMRIEDCIDGRGQVSLALIFNIHPSFKLVQISSSGFIARSRDDPTVAVVIESPPELTAQIKDFSFAPRFGSVQSGERIVAKATVELPRALVTLVRFSGEAGSMQ
jgi:uncharacterized heparinase superfamily protein